MTTLDIKIDSAKIKSLEFYIYSVLLFFSFAVLPFNYFFSETNIENYDYDFDFDKDKEPSKIFSSIRKTMFFMFILSILLISGLVFRPEAKSSITRG